MSFIASVPKYSVPIGQKIRIARDNHQPSWSQYDLAKAIDVHRSTLANWEVGRSDPPEPVLSRIARALRIPIDWFFEEGIEPPPRSHRTREAGFTYTAVIAEPFRRLPLAGYISAGDGTTAEQLAEDDLNETNSVSVPIEFWGPDFFAHIVDGNSNAPYIKHGDRLVFFKGKSNPKGKLIAFRTDQHASTMVKKLLSDNDGRPVLQGLADGEKPVPFDEVVYLGYLIGLIDEFNTLKIGPDSAGIDELYIERELLERIPLHRRGLK